MWHINFLKGLRTGCTCVSTGYKEISGWLRKGTAV